MSSTNCQAYIEKYANYSAFIADPVSSELSIAVVIPCYNEPNIIATLDSLAKCVFAPFHVEVIVVVNASEEEMDTIRQANISVSYTHLTLPTIPLV